MDSSTIKTEQPEEEQEATIDVVEIIASQQDDTSTSASSSTSTTNGSDHSEVSINLIDVSSPEHVNFEAEALLPPTKIKRQYTCPEPSCSIKSDNPRTHLRHRRDVHDHKIRIVKCTKCQYACQYKQKLTRHLRLIHKVRPNGQPILESPNYELNGNISAQPDLNNNNINMDFDINNVISNTSNFGLNSYLPPPLPLPLPLPPPPTFSNGLMESFQWQAYLHFYSSQLSFNNQLNNQLNKQAPPTTTRLFDSNNNNCRQPFDFSLMPTTQQTMFPSEPLDLSQKSLKL